MYLQGTTIWTPVERAAGLAFVAAKQTNVQDLPSSNTYRVGGFVLKDIKVSEESKEDLPDSSRLRRIAHDRSTRR